MPGTHPTVLLRHSLPDGSHHFDWMLARDDSGSLLTFRLDEDISLGCQRFSGPRLPEHRRRYLEYEGPVSGDRGRVDRVARGDCEILLEGHEEVLVRVALGSLSGEIRGEAVEDGLFLFGFQ